MVHRQPADGGKLAVIEGQAGVYAAAQRTDGFKATIADAGTKFQVVASVPGNWDRQLSYDAATTILQQHPDLIGFYCNNDTMALGVVEAVKNAGLLGKVAVFGTDGISDAYKSIRAGELTGTVDSFPVLTGEVALESGAAHPGQADAAARGGDAAGADHQGHRRPLQGQRTTDPCALEQDAKTATDREAAAAPGGDARPSSVPSYARRFAPPPACSPGRDQDLSRREGARRRCRCASGPARSTRCSARTAPASRRCCSTISGVLKPDSGHDRRRRQVLSLRRAARRPPGRHRDDPPGAAAGAGADGGAEHVPRPPAAPRPVRRPRQQEAQARRRWRSLDPAIRPDAPIKQLKVAQRQIVEIARALLENARIIAMDEPTSSLTPSEFERLAEVIAELGRAACRSSTCRTRWTRCSRVCSRATVMRDGRLVGEVDLAATTESAVVA